MYVLCYHLHSAWGVHISDITPACAVRRGTVTLFLTIGPLGVLLGIRM
jgi:hypothetical protein